MLGRQQWGGMSPLVTWSSLPLSLSAPHSGINNNLSLLPINSWLVAGWLCWCVHCHGETGECCEMSQYRDDITHCSQHTGLGCCSTHCLCLYWQQTDSPLSSHVDITLHHSTHRAPQPVRHHKQTTLLCHFFSSDTGLSKGGCWYTSMCSTPPAPNGKQGRGWDCTVRYYSLLGLDVRSPKQKTARSRQLSLVMCNIIQVLLTSLLAGKYDTFHSIFCRLKLNIYLY